MNSITSIYRDILVEAQIDAIDTMSEDAKALLKESAELSELNQKARDAVIKDLNKRFGRQIAENIEVRKELP
mgnify:CR=1 FL=1